MWTSVSDPFLESFPSLRDSGTVLTTDGRWQGQCSGDKVHMVEWRRTWDVSEIPVGSPDGPTVTMSLGRRRCTVVMDRPPLIRCWLTELGPSDGRWWPLPWPRYSIVTSTVLWHCVRIGYGPSAAPALLQPVVTCHNCHLEISDIWQSCWSETCTLIVSHNI